MNTIRQKIIDLRASQSGLLNSQIAKIVGCSKSLVSYYLNDNVRLKYNHRSCKNRKINANAIKLSRGGACVICGYSKCLSALDFHHKDPTQKQGNVGMLLKQKGKLAAALEADKCVLICKNCHAEVHAGITTI